MHALDTIVSFAFFHKVEKKNHNIEYIFDKIKNILGSTSDRRHMSRPIAKHDTTTKEELSIMHKSTAPSFGDDSSAIKVYISINDFFYLMKQKL